MGIKNLKFKIIILVLILFIPTFAKAADIDFHVSIVVTEGCIQEMM